MSALSPLINVMLRAAEKAGRSLRRDFGEVEQLQVSVKGPSDFVSAADQRAEKILIEELKKARPGYSFLIEEQGEIAGSDPRHRWIIDPLDGTINFLNGIPVWCISIACEKDGEIIAGLIYNPVNDEVFSAEKGKGAFMRNKRLRVSGAKQLGLAVIGQNTPRKGQAGHPLVLDQTNEIMLKTLGLRQSGSAALDLAYVAAGRLDGFWQYGLSPWDVAAGYIIIREAGGFITEINGKSDPLFGKSVLASNQALYQDLKDILYTCESKSRSNTKSSLKA